MAHDAVHKLSGHESDPASLTSRSSFGVASVIPANTNLPEQKGLKNKIVFFVGSNMAAHHALRHAVQNLADMGIPCQIFLTDVLPKDEKMRQKLARPEVRNFGFFDKIMINHGYKVLEDKPILLDEHGDLYGDVQYSPNQLSQYYAQRGVSVTVEKIHDINDPAFIDRIRQDNGIVRAYNVRNMQIMSQSLIDAFGEKILDDGLECQVINCHPADVQKYPGTNTVFYARMDGMTRNIWTFHVIVDEKVDKGPIIYTINSALKPGKTLMQDLCAMSKMAGDAISNDAVMFLQDHVMRPATPQRLKTSKYCTYANHDEYLEAARRGIVDVNPHTFIPATVKNYCGTDNNALARELHHVLAAEAFDWQTLYMDLYVDTYAHYPPQYDQEKPAAFFVDVPKKLPAFVANNSGISPSGHILPPTNDGC